VNQYCADRFRLHSLGLQTVRYETDNAVGTYWETLLVYLNIDPCIILSELEKNL